MVEKEKNEFQTINYINPISTNDRCYIISTLYYHDIIISRYIGITVFLTLLTILVETINIHIFYTQDDINCPR